MNISPNVSEKLVKASDQYPPEESLKPWSNQLNSHVNLGKVAAPHNHHRSLVFILWRDVINGKFIAETEREIS